MNILSTNTLSELSDKVVKPRYDRSKLKPGIVHMSLGGFHRAHQAFYINQLLAEESSDWMIVAAGLMPSDIENIEALKKQDNLYTLVDRSTQAYNTHIVGSIKETIHAPTDPGRLLEVLSSENIKIASLTITEKGYYYNDQGDLDLTNENIKADIADRSKPKTAYGYLAQALHNRKTAGLPPFTIMSCDNLPSNGHLTQRLVDQFIRAYDTELADWVAKEVAFPSSMVDRITPATTDATKQFVKDNLGIDDSWPVMSEDYIQWVLEDNFCNGRPAVEKVGVQLVADVEPYEKMKVRLLNGSHSALAYVSYLMGYRKVDDAMADPMISKFVRSYMDEDVQPAVPEVPGIDLDEYKDSLIARFSNPAISDQIQRLAEDGSTKIRNAIIPCVEKKLADDDTFKYAAFALAAWFRYLRGIDEQDQPIEITDPLESKLNSTMQLDSSTIDNMIKINQIFGNDLPTDERFVSALQEALSAINKLGAKQALEELLNT